MIRKLSLLMTILAALGLVVALAGCGKKGPLEAPPQEAALESPERRL
jgi:predicted small lipoprotein YifL